MVDFTCTLDIHTVNLGTLHPEKIFASSENLMMFPVKFDVLNAMI